MARLTINGQTHVVDVAPDTPLLWVIRENVGRYAQPHPARTVQVRFAELGSDAGFIGAAGCARQLVKRGS